MKFSAIVEQVSELLQRQQRISYRALKREFDLDDEDVEDLKAELIDARRLASDEKGKVLVWVGAAPVQSSEFQVPSPPQHPAERRQLTVMFCDLVGSTALSTQLDPEELRTIVQEYQATCVTSIEKYTGYIAQYLGDGLLVYFGYPAAHEDDAARAVRAGLEIVAELPSRARQQAVARPLPHGRGSDSLHLRIGIHTGPVVVGEMGGGAKRE